MFRNKENRYSEIFEKTISITKKEFIQYIFRRYKNFEIKLHTIFKDLDKKKTAGYKLVKF